jgi:uncharacterized protein (DUF488 family)
MSNIFTIGHSNLQIEDFFKILNSYQINILVDIRAIPYAKFSSQFNKENLIHEIKKTNIKYLFLGDLLGGPSKSDDYRLLDNSIDYEKRTNEETFKQGIDRLLNGVQKGYKIVLMCSEKEPDHCHRHLLIARNLLQKNIEVEHIISSEKIVNARTMPFSQLSLFKAS